VVVLTAGWSTGLLLTRPAWPLVAAPVVLAAAAVAMLWLLITTPLRAVVGIPDRARPSAGERRTAPDGRRAAGRRVMLGAILIALLAGPSAWSVSTAQTVHRGANVHSGPGVTAVDTPVGYAPGTTARLPIAVVDRVRYGAAGHDWAAAVVGRRAADLQLASGVPVWSLGGFSGNDPHPTLQSFQSVVAAGRVHYLVEEVGSAARGSEADRIVRWATGAFPSGRVGSWLVVDLTSAGSR
jgi:hypothetical protein